MKCYNILKICLKFKDHTHENTSKGQAPKEDKLLTNILCGFLQKLWWIRSLHMTLRCCGQLWVRHMFCGQDLWWTIPLHIFHWSCWDTLWIPNDHMDLCQTPCVQVPDFSRHQLPIKIGSFKFQPSGLHVLWLLFFSSAPSTFPNKRSTL